MIALVLAAAVSTSGALEGIAGLCEQVAKVVAPQVIGSAATLQVIADGPAYDLADAVRGRCAITLADQNGTAAVRSEHEFVIRVHLRVAGQSLMALVELTERGSVLLAHAVEAPAGASLAHWLAAAGSGIETWVAGSVDGDVLALCGDDGDGDGTAEVAFVTRSSIEIARWSGDGFERVARVELPPSLRPRSRAAGASAACRAADGALIVAFGIHDRDRGGVLRVVKGDVRPIEPVEGVPFGFSRSGQPLVAEGIAGTDLVRWKGGTLAAMTAAPVGKTREGDATEIVGLTQSGTNPLFGSSFKAGTAIAIADLAGDHQPSLIFTRPVFPDSATEDRLVVANLENPLSVRHQSPPIHGVLGAIGVVSVGGWQRVLAVQSVGGRSQIYALGSRTPPAAH